MIYTCKDNIKYKWKHLDFLWFIIINFLLLSDSLYSISFVAYLGYMTVLSSSLIPVVSALDHGDANLLNMYFQCSSNNYSV